MILAKRLELLQKLREWLSRDDSEIKELINSAYEANKWFTPEFLHKRIDAICEQYLDSEKLDYWTQHYHIDDNIVPRNLGIVMAGNIPLVGFHDFLSVFVTGHKATMKLSEKDQVVLKKIVAKMTEWAPELENRLSIADMLRGCDAYIATGSNNSSRYFEYYFSKYPSLIRKNKTSVSILTGTESDETLERLADDVFLYFGLGCRNVTHIYVPRNYNFVKLLNAFKKYEYLKDHAKFRNNYDYNLALLIMNNVTYMSNECVILVEDDQLFPAVSQLFYSYYDSFSSVKAEVAANPLVQCVVADGQIAFGKAQDTGLFDYADGADTIQFLLSL